MNLPEIVMTFKLLKKTFKKFPAAWGSTSEGISRKIFFHTHFLLSVLPSTQFLTSMNLLDSFLLPDTQEETFKHLEFQPVEQEMVNCVVWKSWDEMRRPKGALVEAEPSLALCWDVPTYPCWESHPGDEHPLIPQCHHGGKLCRFPFFSSSCLVLTFSNLEKSKAVNSARQEF